MICVFFFSVGFWNERWYGNKKSILGFSKGGRNFGFERGFFYFVYWMIEIKYWMIEWKEIIMEVLL